MTVFEENDHAGGMLRHGMPAYRMPHDVLDRDIKNITALGVKIKTGSPVKSMAALKKQGYDATFLAVGGQVPRIVPIKGEELANVGDCMEKTGTPIRKRPVSLSGKEEKMLEAAGIEPATRFFVLLG
ncbi:MAG: hypothetical protein L3K26_09165 [Candidatus Hydrogenedentes bacterium]|nr:hypothetical protein [Candidatus Hydrogenedentota bacterium]